MASTDFNGNSCVPDLDDNEIPEVLDYEFEFDETEDEKLKDKTIKEGTREERKAKRA